MSTISSSTVDTNGRYQRLSAEYLKLRNQVSVLKTALLEEQKRGGERQKEMVGKESKLRKLTAENDSLEFRNTALIKRIENLQASLEEKNALAMGKGQKKHREANLRLFGETSRHSATAGVVDSRAVMEQELERKLVENGELHSKIFDLEKQHDEEVGRLVRRISELEQQHSKGTECNGALCKSAGIARDFGPNSTKKNKTGLTALESPSEIDEDTGERRKEREIAVAGLTSASKTLVDGMSKLLSLLEQRSLTYPFDTSMEPLPATTRKYCDILVSVSADLKNTGDALGNLLVTLPKDPQEIRRECTAIRLSVNSTFLHMKADLLPQFVISLREECQQQWCSPTLECLNKEWERKLYIAIDSLISATSAALFDTDEAPTTVSTLHQVFKGNCSACRPFLGFAKDKRLLELAESLKEKNFSENHLPTATKKLKCLNECIEKGIGQLSNTLAKMHSMLTDIKAVAILRDHFGATGPNPKGHTVGETSSKSESSANDQSRRIAELQERLKQLETERRELIDRPQVRIPEKCDKIAQTEVEEVTDYESLVESYYAGRIKNLSASSQHAVGRAEYYKQECEALLRKCLLGMEEREELERRLKDAEDKCELMVDALDTTRENYESQMRGLHEHLAEQNDLLMNSNLMNRNRQGSRSFRENGSLSGKR